MIWMSLISRVLVLIIGFSFLFAVGCGRWLTDENVDTVIRKDSTGQYFIVDVSVVGVLDDLSVNIESATGRSLCATTIQPRYYQRSSCRFSVPTEFHEGDNVLTVTIGDVSGTQEHTLTKRFFYIPSSGEDRSFGLALRNVFVDKRILSAVSLLVLAQAVDRYRPQTQDDDQPVVTEAVYTPPINPRKPKPKSPLLQLLSLASLFRLPGAPHPKTLCHHNRLTLQLPATSQGTQILALPPIRRTSRPRHFLNLGLDTPQLLNAPTSDHEHSDNQDTKSEYVIASEASPRSSFFDQYSFWSKPSADTDDAPTDDMRVHVRDTDAHTTPPTAPPSPLPPIISTPPAPKDTPATVNPDSQILGSPQRRLFTVLSLSVPRPVRQLVQQLRSPSSTPCVSVTPSTSIAPTTPIAPIAEVFNRTVSVVQQRVHTALQQLRSTYTHACTRVHALHNPDIPRLWVRWATTAAVSVALVLLVAQQQQEQHMPASDYDDDIQAHAPVDTSSVVLASHPRPHISSTISSSSLSLSSSQASSPSAVWSQLRRLFVHRPAKPLPDS